ncbi:MAG TPA: transporter associated domain-containing protein, partial [Usitatibacter sp.]|nr:transporter associated domain-containing protein [Usitatibacter sp.]
DRSGRYRVKAVTEIGDFNNHFNTNFSDDDYDTVGGMVVKRFGRLPKRGESIAVDGYNFQVLRADSRKIHSLLVDKPKSKEPE